MAVACVAALGSCGSSSSGKVLNIRCWNNEFEGRFQHYCYDMLSNKTEKDADGFTQAVPNDDGSFTMKDGTKVNFIITANDNNGYQNALDTALLGQSSAADDDKVDMFLVEADYALKYVNSDMTLDVKKDIGLSDSDMSQQYQYTKDIVTDKSGVLKGTTWQACPGLFAYRSDIAENVLGTSDPTAVQAKLADWDKFNAVAKQMKDKNYYMLSGYDDAYRTYSNNISAPLVNSNKEIVIDPQINNWISTTKDYTDKGYNHGTSLWNDTWAADQSIKGSVFGFFYSTWGINFTLKGNAGDELFGKWRVCEGPASYYWGGSWLCAAKGTDNQSQIKSIMQRITCDKATMKQLTLDTLDYTNNKAAMNEIAADTTYGAKFLGGQNHIALFAKSAEKINMSNISAYDQGINENVQNAMKDYFTGAVTLDKAWDNFYTKIATVYPALKRKTA
jgi:hypothetical protein